MKTKVRTLEGTFHANILGDKRFRTMAIQILGSKYPDNNYRDSLGVMGEITFIQTEGESTWFGMHYEVKTDKLFRIEAMAKLAKLIERDKERWDAQPKDILAIIGAVEYKYYSEVGNFIPVTDEGKQCFKIMHKGEWYTSIVAKDEKEAEKKLAKLKLEGATITDVKIVHFNNN